MPAAVVAVALSGGVDSLVAAHLLKKQGHPLIGLHFLTGFESAQGPPRRLRDERTRGASSGADTPGERLAPIARQLGIDVEIVDCARVFRRQVVDYFIETYAAGRTPSPCLVCNPAIKFGVLLEHAANRGARYLATGHYARLAGGQDGRMHLYRGSDIAKDQSYFLARLSQGQLRRALFPLGDMTKGAVKALAQRRGLQPVTASESQDVCFIRDQDYVEFVVRQGLTPRRGPIQTVEGQIIGEHHGLHRFTVGQRRGINCPAPEPYYVVRIDARENRLVVGGRGDLYCPGCLVTDINWIALPLRRPRRCAVKIRYRHRAVTCRIEPCGPTAAQVYFETPQPAVTPGQAAVFYAGDEVLGGGWIAAGNQGSAEKENGR